MKVLVATKDAQGERKNDFMNATEGELVGFSFECDGEAVDGRCGCKRAMSGLTSHRSTTTVKVVDNTTMSLSILGGLIAESLVSAGWYKTIKEAAEQAAGDALELSGMAEFFHVGDVLEKRGSSLNVRYRPAKEKV